MATMYEQQTEDPSLEAFLETRARLRGAAAQALEARWRLYQQRIGELTELRDALMREVDDNAGLTFGERLIAKGSARRQVRGLESKARTEWNHVVSDIKHRFNIDNPTLAIMRDAADYQAAVIASQGKDKLDPVLTHLPGARMHHEASGWDVYTGSVGFGLLGRVELMRVLGDNVIVKGNNPDHIRAGVIAAAERCHPPLKFNGSAAFVAQATQIAKELGIPIHGESEQVSNTISGQPQQTAGVVPEEQAPTSPTDKPPAATVAEPQRVAREAKDLTPEQEAEIAKDIAILNLSELCGTEPADFIDPPHEFKAEGTLVATAEIDGVTYAAIDVNGTLMAVRLDGAPGIDIGAPIEADIAAGGTSLTAIDDVAPEQVVEDELAPDTMANRDEPPVESSGDDLTADEALAPIDKPKLRRGKSRKRR